MTTPQDTTEIIAIAQSYTDEPVHVSEDAETVLQVILDLGGHPVSIDRLCEVMACDYDTMHDLVRELVDEGCLNRDAQGLGCDRETVYSVVS